MSKYYYANKHADKNGVYEIHTGDCVWLPQPENLINIGYFANCTQALNHAKHLYPRNRFDGCYFCCNECHTT